MLVFYPIKTGKKPTNLQGEKGKFHSSPEFSKKEKKLNTLSISLDKKNLEKQFACKFYLWKIKLWETSSTKCQFQKQFPNQSNLCLNLVT